MVGLRYKLEPKMKIRVLNSRSCSATKKRGTLFRIKKKNSDIQRCIVSYKHTTKIHGI